MNAADPLTNARRNVDGHYRWEGVLHPSVTTVLQVVGKEHLLVWYAKMTAVECADALTLAETGHISMEEAHDRIRNWQHTMTAAIRYRDHKAAIGSLTHHLAYERCLGLALPTNLTDHLLYHAHKLELANDEEYALQLAKDATPYVEGLFAWYEEFTPDIEVIGLEAMVVNEEHGYAGTMDMIATVKGWGRRVIDIKTSNRMADTFPMQVEAYRNAEFIGFPATGEKHEIGPTDGIAIIHVQPDKPPSEYLQTWDPNDDTYEAFLSARHLYGVINNMPKPNARIRRTKPGAPKKESKCRF